MPGKYKRCPEGYGVRSMRLLREAKARGMHLRDDGKLVLPSGKVANSKPQFGRGRVHIGIDGETITLQTARVICFLAHGEPPHDRSVADHINGNTLDDSPANLRWATYSENTRNTAYTRTKTREQQCLAACEGLADPSVVPDLIESLKVLLLHRGMMGSPSWANAESAIARAEGGRK